MNWKGCQSLYHANVNADWMKEKLIQINDKIRINVDVSAKKRCLCEKDYMWSHVTCAFRNEWLKHYEWFRTYWW